MKRNSEPAASAPQRKTKKRLVGKEADKHDFRAFVTSNQFLLDEESEDLFVPVADLRAAYERDARSRAFDISHLEPLDDDEWCQFAINAAHWALEQKRAGEGAHFYPHGTTCVVPAGTLLVSGCDFRHWASPRWEPGLTDEPCVQVVVTTNDDPADMRIYRIPRARFTEEQMADLDACHGSCFGEEDEGKAELRTALERVDAMLYQDHGASGFTRYATPVCHVPPRGAAIVAVYIVHVVI
jgi:hypothetical protein